MGASFMRFKRLHIKNYRNFEDIELNLSNKNVIFGLNDIGKTNLLSVMRLFFDRKFRSLNCIESDYHCRNTSNMIEIILEIEVDRISPTRNDEIIISKIGSFGLLSSEGKTFFIKLMAEFDTGLQAGEPKMFWGEDKDNLQEMPTIFNGYYIDKFFSAIYIRDVSDNSSLFKSSVKKLINNDINSDEHIEAIKKDFNLANEKIGELPSIKQLQATISEKYNAIKDENIEIYIRSEAGINNVYSNLNTYIKEKGEENFYPTSGDGRKKMLEYALHTAVTDCECEGNYDIIFVYLIEEPENHIHEAMQLYLSSQIFNTNKFENFFLTTHSPTILYEMDMDTNLIRLYSSKKIECTTLLYNVPKEYENVKKELNKNLANALFYEKVLLVEGPSEGILFQRIMQEIDNNYQILGKYILEVSGIKFYPYYNVLTSLGIKCYIKTDNDIRLDPYYKREAIKYDLLGINRCLEIVNDNIEKKHILKNKKLNDEEKLNEKKLIYHEYRLTIKTFEENNIFLSEVDLENDLDKVIHEKLVTYLGSENPVKYLQDKKMINMIELIEFLTKDDCNNIYNSNEFRCLKEWNS